MSHLPATAKELYDPELSAALGHRQAGSEIVIEVESNRQHFLNHASLLRFRVTNNLHGPCSVTVIARLRGHGEAVEQTEGDREQTCTFSARGDQHIFSFPFRARMAGDMMVEQLRASLTRPDLPDDVGLFELPDQSLLVHVIDPSLESDSPGIVISGGINLDFSQLKEAYGNDIKNVLNLNAAREQASALAGGLWEPILLRHRTETIRPAAPTEVRFVLPGDVPVDMVLIPAGQFVMGSPEGEGRDDERPAHVVQITRDFLLGKYPITQEQYAAVLGKNPSKFPTSPQHPVDNVSWDDAQDFCRRLRLHLKQPAESPGSPVADVRLPTEAQWEYACRAGSQTQFSFGDDRKKLTDYGWGIKNSGGKTQAVGQLKPNAWGLYDVHGNVWEWCRDFFSPGYASFPENDPEGPLDGERRVLRGGSWSYSAKDCRSARRHSAGQADRTANYGFRIVVHVDAR